MRLGSLAVVVVLAGGCQRSPPPEPVSAPVQPTSPARGLQQAPPPPEASSETPPSQTPVRTSASIPDAVMADRTWSARSADGLAEVRQTVLREGKSFRCQSTATLTPPGEEPSVVWTWATCLATRTQLVFVSPDAQRVLVLEPTPVPLAAGWQDVEVLTLHAHGVRMKGVRAGALVRAPEWVHEPTVHFAWVKGPGEPSGTAPRYASGGSAVELETVEGQLLRLGFDGEGFPASVEEQKSFEAAADMYRYEDAAKTTHFVGSLDEVPSPYRSRATRVTSQVITVAVKGPRGEETPPAPPPVAPVEPAPGAAAVAKAPLKQAEVPAPAELLDRAREAVKKVNTVQRERGEVMDSLH